MRGQHVAAAVKLPVFHNHPALTVAFVSMLVIPVAYLVRVYLLS